MEINYSPNLNNIEDIKKRINEEKVKKFKDERIQFFQKFNLHYEDMILIEIKRDACSYYKDRKTDKIYQKCHDKLIDISDTHYVTSESCVLYKEKKL